ncbi:HEAT repeat domain-containing protein [Natronomonas sp.]|uniref:HEAT repeat domain-containing protein n=1 Tax=Natronomonas sp. TaxID=2184060 RepID=UPI00261F3C14|nr:HEAT repeat domain-containing protein [Natronomonas sp.]
MTNGDDEATADADSAPDTDTEAPADGDESGDGNGDESGSAPAPDADVEAFEARLEDLEAALEAADTEADLDDLEAEADAFAADLDAATFPVPEPESDEDGEADGDGDEDEAEPTDPKEPLESRLEDLRDGIETERGPYGTDVQAEASDAAGLVRETRWTRDGKPAVRDATETFLSGASAELGETFALPEDEDTDAVADAIDAVGRTAADGRLDPDADADAIAALLDAVETLGSALEAAEEWDDLETEEQLQREGFYDRLSPENRKDFPPELGVVRVAEAENDPERILMALEALGSEFMEENCIDALRRLGPEAALEPMLELANRRDRGAIEVLGKIGDERAVDTLTEFVDSGNPPLQKVTIRALGEIGSTDASQAVANALRDDSAEIRSIAARALGLIGDTRAIEPLSELLADGTEADEVRGSAAWALVRIGTERALSAAAEYDDDRAYTVQREAEIARDAAA